MLTENVTKSHTLACSSTYGNSVWFDLDHLKVYHPITMSGKQLFFANKHTIWCNTYCA